MQIVKFETVREEIIDNIRGRKLIPFIGSGFTRECKTKSGIVPSGYDYKKYMISEIVKTEGLSPDEEESLNHENFSAISSIYHQQVPIDVQRQFLRKNFCQVTLEDDKCQFLELPWPYVYTLNIDDAIERSTSFSNVVYSNREVSRTIFDERKCVIKLHGDVHDMLTYLDSDSEVFDRQQYALSLFTKNKSLLSKLKHDFGYQNLLFIGCSLDDETDLLAVAGSVESTSVSRYYCTTTEPSFITKSKLKGFGITHCVLFDSFCDMYSELVSAGEEAIRIPVSEIDKYKSTQFSQLSSDFEINKPYLFYGKSLIDKDRTITLPYFFISRDITQDIVRGFENKAVQILLGNGVSGKTYVAIDVARYFRSRNVYYFESKERLSDKSLSQLMTIKNGMIISDSTALSNHQIETILKSMALLTENNTYWLIVSNKSNRDLSGLIKLLEYKGILSSSDVPQYYLPNRFSSSEILRLNEQLVTANLGVFVQKQSVIDNIIMCSRNLSHKHKYDTILPRFRDVREIACLIALATERKVYSSKTVDLDLVSEMCAQQKNAVPLIEAESTWPYEMSASDNSSVKYVINAEYWLIDQLTEFSKIKNNQGKIVEAYFYIVSKLVECYGKPSLDFGDKDAPYKEYILFDNINMLFRNQGLYLIRNIYQGLNDLLATDPHYMHQRAKCLIKSARVESDIAEKKEFLKSACRDAAVAQSVFEKRFMDSGNEKVQISTAHVVYTKALSLCHLCALEEYSDIHNNSEAIKNLFAAMKSPYISYDEAKSDAYNYDNAIQKMITGLIVRKDAVDTECHYMLAELFQIFMHKE